MKNTKVLTTALIVFFLIGLATLVTVSTTIQIRYLARLKDKNNSKELLMVGLKYKLAKQYDLENNSLLSAMKHDPENVMALWFLAENYEELHQEEKALHQYKLFVQLFPNDHFTSDANQRISEISKRLHTPVNPDKS